MPSAAFSAAIIKLLKDEGLRRRLGKAARETVREKFLMLRLAEQYLDLFAAFEPRFSLASPRSRPPRQRS